MPGPQGHLSPESLKSVDWFPKPVDAPGSGRVATVAKLVMGVAAGSAFLYLGWTVLGIVVISVAAVIGLVSIASARGKGAISKAFAALGTFLGRVITAVVVVPTYLVGFVAARAIARLSGNDPLRLRASERVSYWIECDRDERKVRWIRSMFTTEAPQGRRRLLLPAIATVIGFALAAEVLLRIMGFGDPIVYRIDAAAGYYPAPHQDVRRSGSRITTNAYGMRSPDVAEPKPRDSMRLLMIGDSTLYGGSYIDQSELYSTRLDELLSATPNGEPSGRGGIVDVLCAGVNGWGPFNKIGYVERFGTFGADVAVICLPYGDVYRPFRGIEGGPFLPEHAKPRLALEQVAHHLLWRIQASIIGPPSSEMQEYNAVRGIDAYRRLAGTLRDAGCEVLVEVLPSETAGVSGSVPEDEARRVSELRKALAEDGIEVGFPAGLFSGAQSQGPIYHDECHLHTDGHRLYAEYLESRVRGASRRFMEWSGERAVPARTEGSR